MDAIENFDVLVTASDGYRIDYFGGIFQARDGAGVWSVDRVDVKPIGPGSSRYHTVSRADFYIDRDVRQVKAVRILPAPKPGARGQAGGAIGGCPGPGFRPL